MQESSGLKIHQARMKCLERESEVQRTGSEPGETQEEPGQEATHRAQSLHVPEPPNASRVVQQRIKWPQASKRSEWLQFDEDVSNILQATAKGDADSRLQTITTIIFSYAILYLPNIWVGRERKNQVYLLFYEPQSYQDTSPASGALHPQETVQESY